MHALVVFAAACCLAGIDDPLIEKLDAEFQTLVQNDPAATELRKAKTLLEQTNQGSRWTNYISATRIIRRTRSKAAIPLLLRYMISHAEFGSTGSVDTYAETILLLTGHNIGDPLAAAKSTTNRSAARAAVEQLYEQWWIPNKAKLTTDFAKWSRPQIESYVDRFLEKTKNGRRTSPDGEPVSAYDLYHIVKYELNRSMNPNERGWFKEELHANMLPVLLARAGYRAKPTLAARTKPASVPLEVIGVLAKLREDGGADKLDEIAADERQASAARLTCVLAMYGAGEDLMPEVLLSVLKDEKRLEPRLTAIVSLMLCRDTKMVGPTLIKLLDDPHLEVRASAICALYGSRPQEALPKLEKMVTSNRIGWYRSFLLDLIASYGDEEAIRILGEFLKTAVEDERYGRDVSDALSAFEKATGMRWRSAGAHDERYYHEKSAEALNWWRLRESAVARQLAVGDDEQLLHEYRGPVMPLLDAYGRFVSAAQKPTEESLRKFCLPNSVRFTVVGRSQETRFYGQDMNLPFLRDGFMSKILVLRQETDDTYLIRTGTSYIRFVKTASTGWKIYDYGDKPIE